MKKNLQVVVSGHSMWPNLNDGQVIDCQTFNDQELSIGDVILFKHPFNSKIVMIKRIGKSIQMMSYGLWGIIPIQLHQKIRIILDLSQKTMY